MIIEVNFEAAQTGVGYRFFDVAGAWVGARVTSGIVTEPQTGVYMADPAIPSGAVGVYWDCDNVIVYASAIVALYDTDGTATLLSRLSATRAGKLDNLDELVSSRMATFSLPTNFSSLAIDASGRVTVGAMLAGVMSAIATEVESHLLNEGDSQLLINAIVGAIGNLNVDQVALIAAIRADMERVGGALLGIKGKTDNLPADPASGTQVGTRSSHSAGDVWAVGTRSLTDKAGFALTNGERDAIGVAVWAATVRTLTAFGFSTGASAAAVADAVWDELVADHALANTFGKLMAKLNVGAPTVPVVVVPAPTEPDTATGYTMTRDNKGALKPGVTLWLQLVAVDASDHDTFENKKFNIVSDADALAQVPLPIGETYDIWRGKTGTKNRFIVPNTPTFEFPQVIGTP